MAGRFPLWRLWKYLPGWRAIAGPGGRGLTTAPGRPVSARNYPTGRTPAMNLDPLETLSLETPAPHVLVVRLNRPQVSNAMNTQMGLDLYSVWSRLFEDAGDIRCVIFAAAGDRAFCGGGDLKERNGMTDAAWKRQHEIFERAFWKQLDCPIPIIAAVSGHAFAGGPRDGAGQRLRLWRQHRPLRPDRGDHRHHAGRRRHPDPAAGGRRTPGQGDHPGRQALHRRAGPRMGHPEPGLRAGRRCWAR